jgi:hypothetical protein
MSRFYFNFVEDGRILPDPEGCELSGSDTACNQAMRHIREMISHEIRETGTVCLSRSIAISDDNGSVADICFNQAVHISA